MQSVHMRLRHENEGKQQGVLRGLTGLLVVTPTDADPGEAQHLIKRNGAWVRGGDFKKEPRRAHVLDTRGKRPDQLPGNSLPPVFGSDADADQFRLVGGDTAKDIARNSNAPIFADDERRSPRIFHQLGDLVSRPGRGEQLAMEQRDGGCIDHTSVGDLSARHGVRTRDQAQHAELISRPAAWRRAGGGRVDGGAKTTERPHAPTPAAQPHPAAHARGKNTRRAPR